MNLLLTSGETIPVKKGETIFQALKSAGKYLTAPCGAKGICGKCRIRIVSGAYISDSYGNLTAEERAAVIVLACVTRPISDLVIEIPKESLLVVGDKISVSGARNLARHLRSYGTVIDPIVKIPFGGDVEYPEEIKSSSFGVSVDIGTTTIVVYVADLTSGEVINIGSSYNPQIRFGDDVITRIIHATEGGGAQELRDSVVSDINTILDTIDEKHNIRPADIKAAVISANTVMSHMFWGLDTASIREEPYAPLMTDFPIWKAQDAGLKITPEAPVYTMPCIGSYVGGDIVAGVLASKMSHTDKISLFMDIGTNGEIVIGNREWLMTAACSAGPCFEGSGIKCGMRATPGAIESVTIKKAALAPVKTVIGGVGPVGICGSGMIDAISEMLLSGIINQKGKFAEGVSDRIRPGEDGLEYVLYSHGKLDKDIVLTEVDMENILRSKAAIYAGISTLLTEAGLSMESIERVYIAGGFGNYLNIQKAIILGMLPDMPAEKFTLLGNTSITGAYLCLMSDKLRAEAEEIASRMTYIELSTSIMFMQEYMAALFLPHTEMNLFPSVAKLLEK
jgi:uncharacterized 2Fe-2S/4Fe-4S cluster protein (DUF4445 family)